MPGYRELAADLTEVELPNAAAANLDLFLRSVASGQVPTGDDLSDLIEIAVHRARAGIPLDTVLSVYHHGAVAAWNCVAAAAVTPEQRDQLLAAVPLVLGYLGAVVPGVAGAYLRSPLPRPRPIFRPPPRRQAKSPGSHANCSARAPCTGWRTWPCNTSSPAPARRAPGCSHSWLRNTLNYRLNRIATSTGFDPNRPAHAQLYAAALIAHDLDAAE